MKKQLSTIFLTLCLALTLLSTVTFAADETSLAVTVSSFTTGELEQAIAVQLGNAEKNSVTNLTVSGGVLNADDWDFMQNMTGLVSVDLSGATCENNEIPTDAFNNYNSNNPTNGPKYKLKTLVFPSGITTIQNGAFAFCKNLIFSTASWLPESVTTINPLAFQDCSGITSVDLSHVKVLGRQAFQRTGLTGKLVLPNNLQLVSNKSVSNFYIFDGCTKITEIVIGSGITSTGTDCTTPVAYLGGNLFSGTSVTKLTIPGDITYLGSLGKIDSCELEVQSGVQYFGYYPTNGDKAATEVISGTVTAVSLPDSIKGISSDALKEGISVKKIEYHGTATGAGKMTLINRGTEYLETIDLGGSGTTEFSTNGKADKGKLKTIDLSNCTALASVSAVSWRSGGVMNLLGCIALDSVTLGSNDDGSWCQDYTLLLSSKPENLNGTNGVDKGIALVTNGGGFPKNTTFSYEALPTPTKTDSVFVGWYPDAEFSGEAATTATKGTIYYAKWLAASGKCGAEGNNVTWALKKNNTDAANPTYTLTLSGTDAMANYTSAAGQPWADVSGSITKIVVGSGVTTIGDYAFMNAKNAITVELPNGLKKIGQRAFANCHKLQSPTFPSTLTEIGANPFYACNAFDTIVLPDDLTTMGDMLFYECANLSSITIPANATSLPKEFVKDCGKLASIQIPAKITSIGQAAFAGTGLKEITIPTTVNTLGASLFYGCSGLEKVTFEGGAKVQSATFGNCTALKTIIFTNASFGIEQEVNNPIFNTGSDRCVIVLANSEISTDSIDAVRFTLQQKAGGYTDASPAIALVLRGGTIAGEAWGDSVAVPTKTGYTFAGWYDNAAYDGTVVTTPTAGKVYYAKWVKEIRFDANGGSGTMAKQQVAEGDTTATLTDNSFIRTGYTFAGWNTTANGTGTAYSAGANAANIANGTTLYAQWTANTYTVSFNANGGSGSMNDQSMIYDTPAVLTQNSFTKKDENFAGWDTDSSADEVVYADGTQVGNLTATAGNTVTLYAVWTDKPARTPDITPQAKTYNGSEQEFVLADYTVSYQQNGTPVTPKNAGSYDVVISRAEDDAYAAYQTTIFGGLVINKAPLTIAAESKSIYIGDTLPTSYTYTVSGLMDGETLTTEPTLTCEGNNTAAGSFAIVPSGAVADNYEITYVNGTLDVYSRSSSGSSTQDYSVTTPIADNGAVSISHKNAKKGTTVTITVSPDKGYTLETLRVLDKNGREIEVSNKGEGKYTFTMPAGDVTVTASFQDDNTMLNFFVDVTADDYFYDAVLWAVENDITTGMDETHFGPEQSCTRAQIVTLLWRAAGAPETNGTNDFTDVPADAYYAKAVAWAVENGITDGMGDNLFIPDLTCTRAQAVTFLFRYAGYQGMDTATIQELVAGYGDAEQVPDYALSAFNWALADGVVQGYDNSLMPNDDCTRAQIVTMLYRMLSE